MIKSVILYYLPLKGPLPSFPIWANVALLVALEYEVLSDVLVAASDTIANEYSKMSYEKLIYVDLIWNELTYGQRCIP